MSVLIFAESGDGKFKKSAFENIAAAIKIANGAEIIAVGSLPTGDELGQYGANAYLSVSNSETASTEAWVATIQQIVDQKNVSAIIFSASYLGKILAPTIAQKINAAFVGNVVGINAPNNWKRAVFSGKAFANVAIENPKSVMCLVPNSIELVSNPVSISNSSIELASVENKISVVAVNKASGKIVLTEAERVVSAGRGMKGPENWNLIEDLANTIGAATACSKPVSDMNWRPHSEHVGQTGITIKPNLYIAIGISGAIQHLAGISSSKVIVAINKDPEAPIFKIADYGIVADAFEVLPKMIESAKNLMQS